MPIFEYKCADCGEISEFLQGSGKKPDIICAHCGGKDLAKQFSVFAPKVNPGQSKKCHGCSDFQCPHAGQ
jgi:putative FmdB family regulatory protein